MAAATIMMMMMMMMMMMTKIEKERKNGEERRRAGNGKVQSRQTQREMFLIAPRGAQKPKPTDVLIYIIIVLCP